MTNVQIRTAVTAFLDAHWSPDRPLLEWRKILVDERWAAPHWPEETFGRGWGAEQSALVKEVFQDRSAVPAAQAGPRRLAAETILACGSEDQKQRFLKPILTGEHAWCQLFSEPGSGSDLAGLSTRAELKDGQWILNGQKVWNTSAHHADFGILLARTDWDLPKHQGISYFLLGMRQPGVEVLPLAQMNGHQPFNEVFLTNAVVAPQDLMGGEGNGWAVATTTLSVERQGFARSRTRDAAPKLPGRIYEEYEPELRVANEPYTWYPQREGRADLAVPRAHETGAIHDPVVRQELAKLLSLKKAAQLAAASAEASRTSGSGKINPAGSIAKLTASVIARQASHVHTMISGADAMRSGPESAHDGVVAEILVSVPAISIAGGADEIQRNIISERVLGMPRGQRADRGPFRDIKRNL